ncbi:histidine kinase [Egbenema bharatensis]|uniref:histidine kinase n=1 Tax=Egbenema bharatensis TaxID=3463334 RepID=UPI003A83F506
MSTSVKDRISEDLQKAKVEGGLRAGRIREIVRVAVAQTIQELKSGSGEIGTIVKDAIGTIAEQTDTSTTEAQENIAASVEGAIDGVRQSQQEAINVAHETVDHLQAEIAVGEQQLEAEVDRALVELETSKDETTAQFKSIIDAAIRAIRDREGFSFLEQQYVRLKEQLAVLDSKLADRYGENYDQVKQRLENARVWYEETRVRAEASNEPLPVDQKQIELEARASQAGAAIAQKEQQIKQRVKAYLQSVLNRL